VLRPGAYLAAGDLLANVGRLDRVRIRVYVDEPLLGRVAPGQPVTITWEACPESSGMARWRKCRLPFSRWAHARWARWSP
jgi:multidrug resistance efflux pump